MKPLIILALWAFVGWDVGAWGEAYTGLPAVVGFVAGISLGAVLAVEARRRIIAKAEFALRGADPVVAFEPKNTLERAA